MVPTQKFGARVVQHSPVAIPRRRWQLHDWWSRWNLRSLSPEHDQCRPECSRDHYRPKFRHRAWIKDELKLNNFLSQNYAFKVVQSDNNLPLNVEDIIVDEVHQMVIINIGTPHYGTQLIAGSKYRITMNFISYLTDNLVGFYRSSYIENGVRK